MAANVANIIQQARQAGIPDNVTLQTLQQKGLVDSNGQAVQQSPGIGQQLLGGLEQIGNTAARIPVSLYDMVAGLKQGFQTGDYSGALQTMNQSRHLGPLGDVRPVSLEGNPSGSGLAPYFPTAQSLADTAGAGIELGSLALPGLGGAESTLGRIGLQAANGAIQGGVMGLGQGLQQNGGQVNPGQLAGDVIGGTVGGAVGGGAVGGASELTKGALSAASLVGSKLGAFFKDSSESTLNKVLNRTGSGLEHDVMLKDLQDLAATGNKDAQDALDAMRTKDTFAQQYLENGQVYKSAEAARQDALAKTLAAEKTFNELDNSEVGQRPISIGDLVPPLAEAHAQLAKILPKDSPLLAQLASYADSLGTLNQAREYAQNILQSNPQRAAEMNALLDQLNKPQELSIPFKDARALKIAINKEYYGNESANPIVKNLRQVATQITDRLNETAKDTNFPETNYNYHFNKTLYDQLQSKATRPQSSPLDTVVETAGIFHPAKALSFLASKHTLQSTPVALTRAFAENKVGEWLLDNSPELQSLFKGKNVAQISRKALVTAIDGAMSSQSTTEESENKLQQA